MVTMPLNKYDESLVRQYQHQQHLERQRAIKVRAEISRLLKLHPDWPLNLAKAVAENNIRGN
jgi:hypothetical protein